VDKFSFDKLQKATDDGVSRVQDAYGIEKDQELRDYDLLQEQDFDVMASKFGVDATAEYIQEMERRRIKRGNNVS